MSAADNPDSDVVAQDADRAGEFYAGAARERTADALNQKILKLAASEAQDRDSRSPFAAWFRPTAVALSVGLCISLVLKLDMSTESTSLPIFETSDDGSQSDVVDNFGAAAEDSSERIRSIGETASSVQSPGEPTAATLSEGLGSAEDNTINCNGEQSSDPDRWRQCIEQLLEDGQISAARRETDRFRLRYPEMPAP